MKVQIEREKLFYDSISPEKIYAEQVKKNKIVGIYNEHQECVWRIIHNFAYDKIGKDLEGKLVLDIGCGTGVSSVIFAKRGAKVTALDLSKSMINAAQMLAEHYGVMELINFRTISLDEVSYPENSFDYAFAGALLHHLPSLAEAAMKIAKVLKSNGKFVAYEPLSNPFFNFARRFLPYKLKARTPDEQPLSLIQIHNIGKSFREYEIDIFGPMLSLERFLMTKNYSFTQTLAKADKLISQCLPSMQRLFSWQSVITFIK